MNPLNVLKFNLIYRSRYLLFVLFCLGLLVFTIIGSAMAEQESPEGGCPTIEAIDDVPLDADQVEPDCHLVQEELANPQLRDWTAVGFDGTVDEADRNIVKFNGGGAALIRPSIVAPADLTIRYNVTPAEGLFAGGEGYVMKARFRDTGEGGRVVVTLKRLNINTGAVSVLMKIDSDNFAASDGFQVQSEPYCDPNWGFNFQKHAYFVQTTVIRDSAESKPAVFSAVSIGTTIC